jgi:hypothetical protein
MKTTIIAILLAVPLVGGFRANAQIYDTNDDVAETFAGSGTSGYLNAQGAPAMFATPTGIAADSFGNLYVVDQGNSRVREISTNGTVSTFAGGGAGTLPGYGTTVSFGNYNLTSIIVDHSNTLWLLASQYAGLLRIGTDTLVEALGFTGIYNGSGLCVDAANNLYFSTQSQIYRLGTNGTLDLFAGSGSPGSGNGNGVYASFARPGAMAADEAGNIYVWDNGNNLIRRIDQNQNVTTIAGNGGGENVDGVGTSASFNTVAAMASDNYGNVFLASGSCVRKIDASTNVWMVAGSFTQSSYANGAGAIARFSGASGLCLSQGMIFVADSANQRIRSISFNPAAQLVTAPNLGIATYAGITITGLVGRTYQIESSPDMTNWLTVTTLLLTSSPYLWFDTSAIGGNRFYRAFLTP